jgi:hypothetical protein
LLYDAATETFPCEMRIAPMEYDPPMWWLVEEDETAPPESLEGPLLRRL